MSKYLIHPLPKVKTLSNLIPKYLRMWHELSRYPQQETVLRNLFSEHPLNDDLEIVVKKIALLNEYYSTAVLAVRDMAMHILSIPKLDQRLKDGDISLVDEIKNSIVENFSFASKFCSFHNPEAFPIYDSFVAEVLSYYRNIHPSYTKITTDILPSNKEKSYENDFYQVINDFRNHFHLGSYSYKQIDRILWQLGKEFFLEYKLAVVNNYVVKRSGPKDISIYKLLMKQERNGKSAGYKNFHFDIATEKEFDSYLLVLEKCCNYVSRKDGIVGEYYICIDESETIIRIFKKIYEYAPKRKKDERSYEIEEETILAGILSQTANKEGFEIKGESFQDVCKEIVEKYYKKKVEEQKGPIEPSSDPETKANKSQQNENKTRITNKKYEHYGTN